MLTIPKTRFANTCPAVLVGHQVHEALNGPDRRTAACHAEVQNAALLGQPRVVEEPAQQRRKRQQASNAARLLWERCGVAQPSRRLAKAPALLLP
eukprot:3486219-Alexandrium_andersonii.AAC.1